ncbi:MAG: rhodanese-like domain-containing protein [Proteobacteria bacterium]|nr:rhodanese-like domain-containing protein [Pseudomonadota bacterium]
MSLKNLEPQDVARWLAERSVLLIDVREPAEYAAERIHGALLFPLSTFDPKALPKTDGRKVVFQCGSGMRSARAVGACEAAGLAIDSHLKGGLQAWKTAGLPTITADPSTGQPRESR